MDARYHLYFAHLIHEFIGYDWYPIPVDGQLAAYDVSRPLSSCWQYNPRREHCDMDDAPTRLVSFKGIHVTLQAHFTGTQKVQRGPFLCKIIIWLLQHQTHKPPFIHEQKGYQNLSQFPHPIRHDIIFYFAHSVHEFMGYDCYSTSVGGQLAARAAESSTLLSHWLFIPQQESFCNVDENTRTVTLEGIHVTLRACFMGASKCATWPTPTPNASTPGVRTLGASYWKE